MKFELTDEQVEKFNEWKATHKKVYGGAIGGRYSFEFAPSSIGVFIFVEDAVTKERLDLNDYNSF